jgi:hypothetical protein
VATIAYWTAVPTEADAWPFHSWRSSRPQAWVQGPSLLGRVLLRRGSANLAVLWKALSWLPPPVALQDFSNIEHPHAVARDRKKSLAVCGGSVIARR